MGDVRGGWVGAMGCKLNLDKDGDGEIDHIWYPTVPYVTTIGESEAAQATMRIDEQGDSFEYQYLAYRSPVPCR